MTDLDLDKLEALAKELEGEASASEELDATDSSVPAMRDAAGALRQADFEIERREDFIRARGYVRCDIAACNCGKWHGGHAEARLSEIYDALNDGGHSTDGKTALEVTLALIAALREARGEIERQAGQIDWLERNSRLKTPASTTIQDYLKIKEAGEWETPCPAREDKQHCNCWYDGRACCACGDDPDTEARAEAAEAKLARAEKALQMAKADHENPNNDCRLMLYTLDCVTRALDKDKP